MKIGVDLVKKELVQNVRTRRDVALQLVACAVSVELGQHKESYGRETKVVGIDVRHPAVPVVVK